MTSEEKELKRFVEQAATLGMPLKGYTYRNWYDFLNQHGAFYEPRVKPRKVEWGAPRLCFGNAIQASLAFGWTYVEGLALFNEPVHHAWNLRADGKLIDLTWRRLGRAYYGVEFSTGRADDATWNGDACVLDDNHRGWPLLKQPWTGEDFAKEWPLSEPMQLLMQYESAKTKEVAEDAMAKFMLLKESVLGKGAS